MIDNIFKLFGIQDLEHSTEEDQANVFLKILSYIFLLFNIGALVFYILSNNTTYDPTIHFQVGFLQIIAHGLLYSKYRKFGGYFFLTILWAGMIYDAVDTAGIFNPINYAFSMVVTMAIITFGSRKAIIYASMTTIFYVVLYILSIAGYYPMIIGRSVGMLGANGYLINYIVVLWFIVVLQAIRQLAVDTLLGIIRAKDIMLRKSEYLYRNIVEGEQNFYVVRYDENFKFIYVNKAFADFYGKKQEDFIGKSIYDYVIKEEIDEVKKFVSNINKDNPVSKYKYQAKKLDGNNEWQEWIARIIVNGRIEYQSTGRSLDDQMESERIIFQMGLNQAKMEFIEQFASEISHDIRAPLTVLNTSVYLLKRSDTVENQKKYLSQIADVSTDLQKMIENMVSIIKIRDPLDADVMTSIDLSKLVKRITEEAEYLLKSNQKIEAYIEPDVVIDGNYNFLTRALNNLVVNAIQYTKVGGLITISLKSENSEAIIKVTDNGIGIPQEDQAKVFDRLYRSENAKTFFENGSGLGLYIVKMVVDKHHGKVDLKSVVDQGTTFTITLPNQQVEEIVMPPRESLVPSTTDSKLKISPINETKLNTPTVNSQIIAPPTIISPPLPVVIKPNSTD